MFKFKSTICLDGQHIATGESKQTEKKDKEFEKQQTVAIGRGLSFAGFFGDEIATAEEIEDFVKTKVVTAKIKEEDMERLQEPGKGKHHVNKKFNTQEFAKEWMEKLRKQAELSTTVNKFEQGIQVLGKEYTNELEQLYLDPIEDVRVANEYNKLKSQIQGRKPNGQ